MVAERTELSLSTSRDIADSLRLECSILSPSENSQIKQLAHNVRKKFHAQFGRFFRQNVLEEVGDVENRIVVTDVSAFNTILAEWNSTKWNSTKNLLPLLENVFAAHFPNEKFIIMFKQFDRYWDKTSKEFQQTLIELTGSENKAKEVMGHIGFMTSLTHEIVHQYQDGSVIPEFLEIGAVYYTCSLLSSARIPTFLDKVGNSRINFYSNLIQVFGDNVHKLFFGQEVPGRIKNTICCLTQICNNPLGFSGLTISKPNSV